MVRVRHAGVSRKAELLDDDPSELSLREGEGLDLRAHASTVVATIFFLNEQSYKTIINKHAN